MWFLAIWTKPLAQWSLIDLIGIFLLYALARWIGQRLTRWWHDSPTGQKAALAFLLLIVIAVVSGGR